MRVNLAHTLPRSAANGPGERFVVWVQGCPLACPGCWNPDTWAFARRDLRTIDDLTSTILATRGIEGVTFTGGEPFAQAHALAEVGQRVRAAGLSVFVFTGYGLDELTRPEHRSLLAVTDVLVAGRFVEAQRTTGLPWRGSANQEVHFLTDRYGPGDMEEVAEVELHLGADGSLTVTGFPTELELLGGDHPGGSRSCPETPKFDTIPEDRASPPGLGCCPPPPLAGWLDEQAPDRGQLLPASR